MHAGQWKPIFSHFFALFRWNEMTTKCEKRVKYLYILQELLCNTVHRNMERMVDSESSQTSNVELSPKMINNGWYLLKIIAKRSILSLNWLLNTLTLRNIFYNKAFDTLFFKYKLKGFSTVKHTNQLVKKNSYKLNRNLTVKNSKLLKGKPEITLRW